MSVAIPASIAMLATARINGGENYPKVELAIYRNEFDAGDAGSRLMGESEFGPYRVRQFFPGPGCGVIIRENKISYTDDGLKNFIGKQCELIPQIMGDFILVVWEEEPVIFESDEGSRLTRMLDKLRALSTVFT